MKDKKKNTKKNLPIHAHIHKTESDNVNKKSRCKRKIFLGSVKKFVSLVKNGSFLVRIKI